jgi:hypothetical protein
LIKKVSRIPGILIALVAGLLFGASAPLASPITLPALLFPTDWVVFWPAIADLILQGALNRVNVAFLRIRGGVYQSWAREYNNTHLL